MIQVCANKSAADSIWLELTLDIPSPNDYDKPKDAYSFGTLSNTVTSNVTFHAGCQSVDSSGEKCNALGADYSESAWLTFTTPSYLDIANIGISVTDVNKGVDTLNIGYNLYEGDAKSNSNKLSLVDGCRVFQNICYEYNQYFYCDANFNQTYNLTGTRPYLTNMTSPILALQGLPCRDLVLEYLAHIPKPFFYIHWLPDPLIKY